MGDYTKSKHQNETDLLLYILQVFYGLATSLSRGKIGEGKKRERLVILGMLINIHELSSLAFIFKMMGLFLTVSSKI